MASCFVIQPFDSGRFDKRFDDVYRPAIEAAGLEAYRVDRDHSVVVPIDAIETGIRNASICLADITVDNPNVWYELGFAFASGRPVVMVCSEERTGKKYPFDIQHRTIVTYVAESTSDFERLQARLTAKFKALLEHGQMLQTFADAEQVAPVEGLSQHELVVLAVVAGSCLPGETVGTYAARRDAERAGLTNMGFNLGFRRLRLKEYVEITEVYGEQDSVGIRVTERGWAWIEKNEALFKLHRTTNEDGDIPF